MPATHKNWQSLFQKLEGAYSPATLKSYAADIRQFEAWSIATGNSLLPASPENLIAYIAAMTDVLSAATMNRRLAAIAKLHALAGLPDSTKCEDVRLAMRRMKRAVPTRQDQALGLTQTLRDRLIEACPVTLIGLRDKAMIAIGYDTLCRRSELVALQVEDITPLTSGGARILVRRAKNDPFGRGRTAYLSAEGYAIVNEWMKAAGLGSGPLFRILYHGEVGRRGFGPDQVGRILKRAAELAGIDAATIAGIRSHSMRVGAAQDLLVQGRETLQIMRAGGWKSINTVSRYCENADLNIWL